MHHILGRTRRATVTLASVAALGAGLLATTLAPTSDAAAPTPEARKAADCGAYFPLTDRAWFNDPRAVGDTPAESQNDVQDLFECTIARAAPGSSIKIDSWNFTDKTVADALVAAHQDRNVDVKVVLANANCDSEGGVILRGALGTNTSNASFVSCVTGSARVNRPGTTMHQKSFLFSQIGSGTSAVKNVTITGSANATDEAVNDQWVDMFVYPDRADVYDAYNQVFQHQKNDENMASPYFAFTPSGEKWAAWFFPVNQANPTKDNDPVYKQITSIPTPADHQTVFWVANYAANGDRGAWLANALAAKKRAGAFVRVFVGPPATARFIDPLRAAGVTVDRAGADNCSLESNCNYIHLKLMTVKYWADNQWNYRVYTGSDNWSDASLNNDEVIHRIGGPAAYNQYQNLFDKLVSAYG